MGILDTRDTTPITPFKCFPSGPFVFFLISVLAHSGWHAVLFSFCGPWPCLRCQLDFDPLDRTTQPQTVFFKASMSTKRQCLEFHPFDSVPASRSFTALDLPC